MDNLPKDYHIENDLNAHILYKNFEGEIIPENEPLILEVKKGFKIYDLLNQIKQISKIAKNIVLPENEKNSIFPKFIIGFLCSYNEKEQDKDIQKARINMLNRKYKDTNITLLEHDVEVINKNKVNVIICYIKDHQIKGYNLSREDYYIDGNRSTRVDLYYLCSKICPGEDKTNKIKLVMEKYKDVYKSLTYEKTYTFSEYKKIENEKKVFETRTQALENEKKVFETRNQALENENNGLKKKNKELEEIIEKLNKQLDEQKKKQENKNG